MSSSVFFLFPDVTLKFLCDKWDFDSVSGSKWHAKMD